ncbi:MAG: RNA-directed DNA polymerase [Coprobacillus cateniformis]|nr:RNA-directed DNA polymerase [Coprobacillus cateniformis]
MKNITLSNNPLYNLKSKNKLKKLLYVDNFDNIINQYDVFIAKPARLVEKPSNQLKIIHTRIFKFLKKIEIPDYLFSSKKGKCYIDNARLHQNNSFVVTLDLSKFFPKSNASHIYNLFEKKFNMSKDVAYIMTQICSIDTSKITLKDSVKRWYQNANNKLKYPIPISHVPTGSCTSQIIAFLSFIDMFEEMNSIACCNNITFSVFVDDIIISSNQPIKRHIINKFKYIATKYGHEINKSKIKYYGINYNKRITGVIITKDHRLKSPSKNHFQSFKDAQQYKINPSIKSKQRTIGRIQAVRNIEKQKFIQLIKDIKQV